MRLRAFVFDDDEELRRMIASILERRGYEVFSYSEPLFCPIYLDRECPCPEDYACGDIFITDNSMPNVTGLEFIENQIRLGCKAIEKNKVLMSGKWTKAELERAKSLGCKICEKPFRTNKLLGWLDECEKRVDPSRKLSDLPLRYESDRE